MDEHVYLATRRSLHAVAELLLAGPQYRAKGTIRLRARAGGFSAVAIPVHVEGVEIVSEKGRTPLTGTCRQLSSATGYDVGRPEGVYDDTSGVGPDDPLAVDPEAAGLLAGWFARGDAALHLLAPDLEPVLWPEHFDLAVSFEGATYGASPGDELHPLPYAYVIPPEPRQGPFWNAPFGALRAADELPDATSIAAFFAAAARPAD